MPLNKPLMPDKKNRRYPGFQKRLNLVGAVVLLACTVLVMRLWHLQVVQWSKFLQEQARALGDPDTLAIALTARLTATWSPDTIARPDWFDLVGEAERHATAAVDPERHGEFRWLRLISGFAVNDVATVREEVERYGEHATSIGQPSQQWYAVVMRTIVRLMDGCPIEVACSP